MFKDLYKTIPDISEYLERMGAKARPLNGDRESLDSLIMAHLQSVPFENLDIYDYKKTIPLGIPQLYEKLVTNRRGGFCFELNALFMALLQGLGYECEAYACRVMWNKDHLTPPGHRATVVTLQGHRLFCDVGFGGPSPCKSLLLDFDGIQSSPGGDFLIKPDGRGNRIISRVSDSKPEPVLMLIDHPMDPVDFLPLSEFFSKNPVSSFTQRRMANIKIGSGTVAIDGSTLRIRSDGELIEKSLSSAQEIEEALKEYFGIEVRL